MIDIGIKTSGMPEKWIYKSVLNIYFSNIPPIIKEFESTVHIHDMITIKKVKISLKP